jgi:microcystin-dependent protein
MDPYIAQVLMFGGSFAPQSWAYCDGSLLSIGEYSPLFSLLGTTYGGDGQQTFGLPDFRGRVAVGTGQGAGLSPVNLGDLNGSNSVSLTLNTIPSHSHTINIPTTDNLGTTDDPNGNILTSSTNPTYAASNSATGNYGGVVASIAGNNIPVDITAPYLGMNFIICLEGIYPSRN